MIKKYGKVIIEKDTITITEFHFDYKEMKRGEFDAIKWAKQRLSESYPEK